jgi:hypothetical protein
MSQNKTKKLKRRRRKVLGLKCSRRRMISHSRTETKRSGVKQEAHSKKSHREALEGKSKGKEEEVTLPAVYLCDSYRPRLGLWRRRPDCDHDN